MTKRLRKKNAAVVQPLHRKPSLKSISLISASIAFTALALVIGANATDLLKGQVQVDKVQQVQKAKQEQSNPSPSSSSKIYSKLDKNLLENYGAAAKSTAVKSAIKKAVTKEASDRDCLLSHGYWRSGDDPMKAIMYGYVPPGMTQEQAAIFFSAVPHLPKKPDRITPEQVAAMEPVDPKKAILQAQGVSLSRIEDSNQKIFEAQTRDKFGSISIPLLHRGHNFKPQSQGDIAARFVREDANSGSIQAQYSYDPFGNQTKLQGNTVDSDFGYAGMYIHQRSGLNLAVHRAYNPKLGRWMNRDPIDEPGFLIMQRSPEPTTPNVQSYAPTATTVSSAGDNLYSYVSNDPVAFIDPSGLSPYFRCCRTYDCCAEMWQKCLDYGGSLTCCTAVEVSCNIYIAANGGNPKRGYGNVGWNSCYRQRPKYPIQLPIKFPSPTPSPYFPYSPFPGVPAPIFVPAIP